ncbi:hypothetical protein ES705_37178 [subsurface metagenome]
MPKATFTISGDIEEFDRVDNLYRSLKREGAKMLKNWKIEVNAEYTEVEGEKKE